MDALYITPIRGRPLWEKEREGPGARMSYFLLCALNPQQPGSTCGNPEGSVECSLKTTALGSSAGAVTSDRRKFKNGTHWKIVCAKHGSPLPSACAVTAFLAESMKRIHRTCRW